jgi:N-acetylneuraminic acid mutarotase
MYVLGGQIDGGVTASVLKSDGADGSWSEAVPMPAPRERFASCAYKSSIYVFGGSDARSVGQASVFKFDIEANKWSRQAPMPHICTYHHASILNGEVYIVGAGYNGREVLRFNFATNAWSTLVQTIYRRDRGVSFVLADSLYAAGGEDGSARESMERYDLAANTWTVVAEMLEGRSLCRAICIEHEGSTEEQDLFDSLIAKALTQRM